MTKQPKTLMAKANNIARDIESEHVEKCEGEKCFNVYSFQEHLASELIDLFDAEGRPNLDAEAIAWFIVASREMNGMRYKGMPTLG